MPLRRPRTRPATATSSGPSEQRSSSSSWPAIVQVDDSRDVVGVASSTFADRAGRLADPPPVALLGPGGVEWLHRGPGGEPALLWADAACLVEVLEGRATTLGALLAGAARCETTAPPW